MQFRMQHSPYLIPPCLLKLYCIFLELIPHDEIVKQLAADTLTNSASTGICGDTFLPGKFSTAFMLQLKVFCHFMSLFFFTPFLHAFNYLYCVA